MIARVSDNIVVEDKRDLVRLHFYIKYVIEKDIPLTKGDLDVLTSLYFYGPIENKGSMDKFILLCMNNGSKGSNQSVRNSMRVLRSHGIINKSKNSQAKYDDDDVLPYISEQLQFQYTCDSIIKE